MDKRSVTEKRREDHKKGKWRTASQPKREMERNDTFVIHSSIYSTYEQLPHTFFSFHNWCARFCHLCRTHTHSHFIFVMCNDVPTFYMWTRKGIEVCGLDQFTHWLQLHTHTHTQIHQYVCTHQMFGWMSWDQIPSWSISTLRWCWQYDGALALARRLASVAFSLHIIQFLVWIEIISMCSTSSTLFQHAIHQWDALSPYSVCLKYRYCACHCCCCYDAKLLIISFHLISCLIIYTCTVPVQKKTNVCIEIWYALQCIAS